MVSTDQSLGMQTKQTQVFNQYKKEQPPPLKYILTLLGIPATFALI